MKKYLVKSALCIMLVAVLCFSDFAAVLREIRLPADAAESSEPAASTSDATLLEPEQSEGVVRPEAIDEGLSLYSLDDIRLRRVTVRQPVMEILEENIPRKPVPELSDVYELWDYGENKALHELAKIDFAGDPTLETGNKDHPRYPMKGLSRSPKDEKTGNVTEQPYFSPFKKYMLLHQAWDFNAHAGEIIKNGELKKHPAADYIYGKIPAEATAVRMRIVTDPIYRSPMTTGLYLAPGEVATVKIKGLEKGETLSLYTHHQDTMGYLGYNEEGKGFGKMEDYLKYWDDKILAEAELAQREGRAPNFEDMTYGIHGQWLWQNQKVPCMGTTFSFVGTGKDMEVQIGSMYGGPLYIKPTSDPVEVEIAGAVLTPHFVLGVTTVEEFEEQLRNAPGLIATLDVENGQLIGPAEAMRNADDIEKLAYFWHSVFAIDISLNGREYNYNMTMCYDMHVPAGEAVALNSNFCAQPEYWFPICMNYETLTTKGNWGTFHELGHVQAKTHGVNWGFCDGDGEVWNNTLILLIYSMLCNMDSRVIGVEHGEYVHPFTAIERSQKITKQYTDKETGATKEIEDYGQINEGNGAHFDQLSMYATLLHSFGPEKFVDMFYTYKMDPAYCSNKRADFVYRIGVVDRVNILNWVNTTYFANIKPEMFTKSQREFLNSLPDFTPVAYRWANGIDGHETARKHDVDGKHETVFDVSRENFSSPGSVEVVSVSNATYGETVYNRETQQVTYTPPEEVTEYDRFDIIVKTDGGRQVTMNVCLRLLYHGVYTEVWDLGSQEQPLLGTARPTIEQAQAHAQTAACSSTETGSVAGKGDFNHAELEYFRSAFKFRATESGSHTFYVRADDEAIVKFYKNGDDKTGTLAHTITSKSKYNFSLTDPSRLYTVELKKGDILYITAELVNWGGPGNLRIGLCMPGETYKEEKEIKDIPTENLIGPNVTDEELLKADSFKGWQPRFVDSIKNTAIDYQNTNEGWEVLEAPVSEGGDAGQAQYRKNMVDGDEATIYHSKYNGGVVQLPHVFVIDTKEDQTFNYFDIIRRTNGNDKLLRYELYSCTGEQYQSGSAAHADPKDTQGWTKLFEGASTNVNAARQRINFARTQVRYFKLIITENSGHTVIREVYAGITSDLSQTVKPRNYMTSTLAEKEEAGFVENAANGKLSTKKSGATFKFKFLGNGFELYADTDPAYGKATVLVDGTQKGIIDLDDRHLFNKLVFFSGELEMAEHEVVVTTQDDRPFNISFINVQYGTPVAAGDYPATTDGAGNEDYGDQRVARQFTREWKTYVKDYKTLTSIRFAKAVPSSEYKDTYVRIDTYIRLYRDGSKIAFVYPGTILSPIECGSLFSGCEKLTELVFENFDTTYMRGAMNMFYGCKSLKNLDVSKFTTENVLSFGKMFGECTSLTDMDLGAFKLDENANLYRMFENCTALETIELPDAQGTAPGARTARSKESITLELPYVYQDEQTRAFVTEIALDASTAGHTLRVHKTHTFNAATTHERVAPKCEEAGTLAYKTCLTCGCDFDYDTGKTLYREGELVIPARGHEFVYEEPTKLSDYPTCTKPGAECRHYCKYCNMPCPDDEGKVAMPAIGHSYMLDTSKGDGKGYTIAFRRAEVVEKTEMIDENGESYYTQEEVVVKGIAKVTFYLKCQGIADWDTWDVCGHEAEVVFEFECDTHTEATCMEAETFFYEFSIDETMLIEAMALQDEEDDVEDGLSTNGFRSLTVNQVVEGEEAEGGHAALGHVVEDVAAVPSTCEGYGSTAGRKCSVCGTVLEGIQSTAPHGHVYEWQPAVAATCTEAGHSAGHVCRYCGIGKPGEGVEVVPALGHDFSIEIAEEAPTCTHLGYTAGKKCSRCDAVEGHDTVDDLGHLSEILPRKEPTETESGLTEGRYCPRCGEILEEQQEIPARGTAEPPAPQEPQSPTPEPQQQQEPKNSKLGLWIGIGAGATAAASGLTAAIVVIRKRRRL